MSNIAEHVETRAYALALIDPNSDVVIGTPGAHGVQLPRIVVSAMVDLSADGTPRGAGPETPERSISLPHRLVDLHLVLPYYSPAGNYHITVSADRNEDQVKAEGSGSAVVQGSRSEVQLKLDLSKVTPGKYYLATSRAGDGAPYYYPLTVK